MPAGTVLGSEASKFSRFLPCRLLVDKEGPERAVLRIITRIDALLMDALPSDELMRDSKVQKMRAKLMETLADAPALEPEEVAAIDELSRDILRRLGAPEQLSRWVIQLKAGVSRSAGAGATNTSKDLKREALAELVANNMQAWFGGVEREQEDDEWTGESTEIDYLVQLLRSSYEGRQLFALRNLLPMDPHNWDHPNYKVISEAVHIRRLVELLGSRNPDVAWEAASIVYWMSVDAQYRSTIPAPDAIPKLRDLVQPGNEYKVVSEHATGALFSLTEDSADNRATLVECGCIPVLVQLLCTNDTSESAAVGAARVLSKVLECAGEPAQQVAATDSELNRLIGLMGTETPSYKQLMQVGGWWA